MTTGSPARRPAAFRISSVETFSMGRSMTGICGRFRRIVSAAKRLQSTATRIWNPALSSPKSRPRAPENNEITGSSRFVIRVPVPEWVTEPQGELGIVRSPQEQADGVAHRVLKRKRWLVLFNQLGKARVFLR